MHQSNQAHIVPSRGSHPMDSFSSQMTAPMSLNSYDYFETGDGWIYITVCLFQDDGIVLGKTAYSPTGKKSLRGIIDDSEHPTYPTCSFGGIATYLIPIKEVIKIYNPFEFDHVIESIGLLRKIRHYANISGFTICMFGSRVLECSNENSDLDIIIDGNASPRSFLDRIISQLPVRLFNKNEIDFRIRNYCRHHHITMRSLEKLMHRGTIYLKDTKGGEIGVFFRHYNLPKLPDMNSIELGKRVNLSGIILNSNGMSYNFPRIFSVRVHSGKTITIISPLWEINGIEELHGKILKMENARETFEHSIWIDQETEVEIL